MDNQHDEEALESELEQIAIVGMSGRFPGANTIEEFWSNLSNGVESVSTFSDEQLLSGGVKPEQFNDPNFVRAGAVLDNIEQFDAGFFDFTPREAQITDPQHRILLECSYEALENAACVPASYDGDIGIYAGVMNSSYYLNNLHPQPDFLANYAPLQIAIGTEKGFAATKVAYKLGLTGPAINIDTACSTSLVAIHQACKALLSYECDMALAGGACINVPQTVGHMYLEGGIATPDGHCRAFDADARGTLRGAGAGIVVLKRLSEALEEGDTIHALIKGSAVNNDGFGKLGFTAPSIKGQTSVISSALEFADVDASTVGYIETHGTGTPLGDPIEVEALSGAFRQDTDETGYCALSSLKTNIGHLDMAAGVAGLIKATLALKHQKIPANLHYKKPNPQIDFAASTFYVNTELADWKLRGDHPRRAGISGFGIGGTNAHIVLEEAPLVVATATSVKQHVLKLSTKSKTSLQKQQHKLAEFLTQNPNINLADVAYTLQSGRIDYDYRQFVVCSTVAQAI
ncbi:MAG: hypothetical protein HRT35_32890 [Algicola sp.]|nr:hypothetical protein [Algicola sp.]